MSRLDWRHGLIGIGLCAAGAFFYFQKNPEMRPSPTSQAVSTSAVADPAMQKAKVVTPKRVRNEHPAADSEYVCTIMKHLCLEEPLLAATEVEARWLKQFGYPSKQRLEQLERMSITELEALSAAGDLPARAIYGRKQVELGRYVAGRSSMMDAVVSGSTYAAYELARSERPDVPHSSRIGAATYYRLAYLLGDWKASREMYRTQTDLDVLEMRMADERAMHLYRNILDEKGRRRIGFRVWPRP
ncbi:MAG: hypothetical protein WKF61_08225 [Luteimonas sp.]